MLEHANIRSIPFLEKLLLVMIVKLTTPIIVKKTLHTSYICKAFTICFLQKLNI